MTPLQQILAKIAADEGGVKDIGDGKGVTHYGQTQAWLDKYGLPVPKTPEEAMANWETWVRLARLDAIVAPEYDVLAHGVIDYAVHSGTVLAVRALQSALRVNADGVIGPKTLAALARADRRKLSREVIAAEIEFQGVIITKHPELHARYAAGWAARNARLIRRLE